MSPSKQKELEVFVKEVFPDASYTDTEDIIRDFMKIDALDNRRPSYPRPHNTKYCAVELILQAARLNTKIESKPLVKWLLS